MDILARVTAQLRARLAALGRKHWPLLAAEMRVSGQLPSKVVYQRAREFKPRTLQPLIQFFDDVEQGRRTSPVELVDAAKAAIRAAESGAVDLPSTSDSGPGRRALDRALAAGVPPSVAVRVCERRQRPRTAGGQRDPGATA
jgi:hypothetical protein